MAIYHLSAKVHQRKAGHSAVAAAAYRSGTKLMDPTTGELLDYSRKKGVVWSHVYTPDGAPAWAADRQHLWAKAEAAEVRKDAQVCREVTVALPDELRGHAAELFDALDGFIRRQFVAAGMAADVSIHLPSAKGDARNLHAHIQLTMRPFEGEAFGKKAREWNDRALLGRWREAWAESCNTALERAGHQARIDHRSLAAQGVERAPTIHIGPAATAMERRGIRTPRGDRNREIQAINAELAALEKAIQARQRELAAEAERAKTAPKPAVSLLHAGLLKRGLMGNSRGATPPREVVPPMEPPLEVPPSEPLLHLIWGDGKTLQIPRRSWVEWAAAQGVCDWKEWGQGREAWLSFKTKDGRDLYIQSEASGGVDHYELRSEVKNAGLLRGRTGYDPGYDVP